MEQTEVTKKQLAEHLGVSQARISQMVAAGLPFGGRRVIPLKDALEWVRTHVDLSRPAAKAPGVSHQPNVASAPQLDAPPRADPGEILLVSRALKLQVEARRLQRLERLAAGEVIDGLAAREYARDLAELVRDAHLAQADRLTDLICATAGAGANRDEIYRLLRADNHRTLDQLSKLVAAADPAKH